MKHDAIKNVVHMTHLGYTAAPNRKVHLISQDGKKEERKQKYGWSSFKSPAFETMLVVREYSRSAGLSCHEEALVLHETEPRIEPMFIGLVH